MPADAAGGIILRRGIWAFTFGKRLLRRTSIREHAEQTVIPFVATALVDLIFLIAVLRQFLYRSPWSGKRGRILIVT